MAAAEPRSRDDLAEQLRSLGLGGGDIVLVRAALKAVGPVQGKAARTVIEALLEVVGHEGTIVGLAHTEAGLRSDTSNVFNATTPPITGGFAAAMLEWEGAVRSTHPTNSMVAIGRDAATILSGHDETSTCFGPMQALIDRGGKMALIGCIESSPGFSSVHLVYEDLGLATKSLVSGLYGAYIEAGGERRWWAKRDVPGCSMGFGHFYPLYRQAGVLSEGSVGEAASMLIDCRDAYAIERRAVTRDRTISLCDDPGCLSCRGTKLFNMRDWPAFYARRPRMLAGLLRSQAHRLIAGG